VLLDPYNVWESVSSMMTKGASSGTHFACSTFYLQLFNEVVFPSQAALQVVEDALCADLAKFPTPSMLDDISLDLIHVMSNLRDARICLLSVSSYFSNCSFTCLYCLSATKTRR
jgi:hypothetical protein